MRIKEFLQAQEQHNRDCSDCVNCASLHGFMCTCHYSYDEVRDGTKYLVGVSQDVSRMKAKKCEHYSEVEE